MFNKSSIMRRAWEIYRTVRYECERRSLAKGFIKERFRNALRTAWAEARVTPVAKTERLTAELLRLEHSDTFSSRANERMHAIRSELAQIAA